MNPPGEGDPVALGARAGLLAPASRGTATPTGRAGTASGPSRWPWAGGARLCGLGRPQESAPKARPAPLGLACPEKGKASASRDP